MVVCMYNLKELIEFMEEYAEFFDKMVDVEEEKLNAILSYNLKELEKSVASQQSIQLYLERMEKKREAVQERANLTGKTISQIISLAENSEKDALQEIFERIQESVEDVRYLNSISMDKVKENLNILKDLGGKELPDTAKTYGPGFLKKAESWKSSGISFQKKI